VKICFISDTHDLHDQVTLPPADILVHAGDLTMDGVLPASVLSLG
jgi:predicted phosphodiesterase